MTTIEEKNSIAYDRIVWSNISSFECPRCKKIVLYYYESESNYCVECKKNFTEEEIYNCEEKKKIKFKVKSKD